MTSSPDIGGRSITHGESYIWEPPEKSVTVEIDFDVIDRLGRDIQRGVDGSAWRGLEIGGILLGRAESGERVSVRIEDYEPVPCSYSDGPSYVMDGEDLGRFKDRLEQWQEKAGTRLRAVGFFRAQTRDGLALQSADRDLLDLCFPDRTAIALLVKPFATRPPQAGIFFREEGVIRGSTSYREFPFRRTELGGGETLEEAPAPGGQEEVITNQLLNEAPSQERAGRWQNGTSPETPVQEAPAPAAETSERSAVPARTLRLRGGWIWVPLSFIFLLVGTVLGFQVALSVQSKIGPGAPDDPYTLNLTATPSADSVHLRWDRRSPAIQRAERGTLLIREDGREKSIDLDAGHLRHGSVIYRQASDELLFRLEIFMGDHVSVTETVEYRPLTPKSASDDSQP